MELALAIRKSMICLPPLRLWQHRKARGVLLLAVMILAFAGIAPSTLASFDEGTTAYKAGNFKLAYEEFLKAAEQGDAEAQFYLGVMYDKGRGVPRDYVDAMQWYRKAAVRGVAEAQYNLALMYDKGQGIKQDYMAAARWYREAADQGLAEAQNNLGLMYDKGQGVPRNYIEAYMWYSLAAAQADDKAARNLDLLEKRMTPAQIATAQERARNWRPSSGSENDR